MPRLDWPTSDAVQDARRLQKLRKLTSVAWLIIVFVVIVVIVSIVIVLSIMICFGRTRRHTECPDHVTICAWGPQDIRHCRMRTMTPVLLTEGRTVVLFILYGDNLPKAGIHRARWGPVSRNKLDFLARSSSVSCLLHEINTKL
jgi:hypothetical protein